MGSSSTGVMGLKRRTLCAIVLGGFTGRQALGVLEVFACLPLDSAGTVPRLWANSALATHGFGLRVGIGAGTAGGWRLSPQSLQLTHVGLRCQVPHARHTHGAASCAPGGAWTGGGGGLRVSGISVHGPAPRPFPALAPMPRSSARTASWIFFSQALAPMRFHVMARDCRTQGARRGQIAAKLASSSVQLGSQM